MKRQQNMSYLIVFFILVLLMGTIVMAKQIPQPWTQRVARAAMLATEQMPDNPKFNPYVGNGYLGAMVHGDSIFISGVFNGPAISERNPSHRARVPGVANLQMKHVSSVSAKTALPLESQWFGLDMEWGMFTTRSTYGQGRLVIEERLYAHRSDAHSLVLETVLVALDDTLKDHVFEVCYEHDASTPSSDIAFAQIASTKANADQGNRWKGRTHEQEDTLFPLVDVSVTMIPDTGIRYDSRAKNLTSSFCTTLSARNRTFSFVVSVATSIDAPGVDTLRSASSSAQHMYAATRRITVSDDDSFYPPYCSDACRSHVDAWSEIWKSGFDIEAKDHSLAAVVNSSLYYIISSIREDRDFSLSPGSLATNMYNGHVFWDGETWCYPPLLLLRPEYALSMLRYRQNRLDGARAKAKTYKPPYSGTMFPWESAASGIETCPTFATTGLYEVHISGDISFAVRQYLNAQKLVDTEAGKRFLPMLRGIAEFYVSRSTANKDGTFSINGVIPPDEYVAEATKYGVCNDSVYTNAVAQIAFDIAVEISQQYGQPVPSEWQQIAQRLRFPYDTTGNVFLEYAGYNGHKIKQADVVLLQYPLEWPGYEQKPARGDETKRNELAAYARVTDQAEGPAMTWSTYSINYLKLNDQKNAAAYFVRGFEDNLNGPFLVWSESIHGKGANHFLTGAGGFLQSLFFGYAGIRIESNAIAFNPQLAPDTTSNTARGVAYQGRRLTVRYDQTQMTITLDETASGVKGKTLVQYQDGKSAELCKDRPLSSSRMAFKVVVVSEQ